MELINEYKSTPLTISLLYLSFFDNFSLLLKDKLKIFWSNELRRVYLYLEYCSASLILPSFAKSWAKIIIGCSLQSYNTWDFFKYIAWNFKKYIHLKFNKYSHHLKCHYFITRCEENLIFRGVDFFCMTCRPELRFHSLCKSLISNRSVLTQFYSR